MVRYKIISIVIALGICMGLAGFTSDSSHERSTEPSQITEPDTSLASGYQVLGERDLSTGSGRTGKEWCILSSVETFEARAQTAMRAAFELQKKSGADYVSIKLTPIPKVGCSQYIAASAEYCPDGLGINGKQTHSVWSVSASNIVLGPEEVLVAIAWAEALPKIAVDDHVDLDKMSEYLSKQLNLTPKQVKTYRLRCLEMGMTLRRYPVENGPDAKTSS